jgi:hypothetical protein
VKDQFTTITKHAFQQLVRDRINERLKGAMTPDTLQTLTVSSDAPESELKEIAGPSQIEIEAFQIIRAILRPVISPSRVFLRDAASYCAILFDDNNRKPICRLRFNNESRLVVGLFDEAKDEERISIENLDRLFDFDEKLRACVSGYLSSNPNISRAEDARSE